MEKYPIQKLERTWIQNGITPEIVEWTKSFGEHLCSSDGGTRPLTTGQIRKFFGEVRRIDSDVIRHKDDIPMLKPMLAYAVGRDKNDRGQNKTKIKEFVEELIKALDAIRYGESDKIIRDYKNFVKLFESLVAYHKYFGGKD